MITVEISGRFGNNVEQFINAIYIAEQNNIPRIRYNFPQFKENNLKIPTGSVNFIKMSDNFVGIHTPFKDRSRIARTLLLPILKYSNVTNFEPYYEDGLFVHIRSGDIFKTEDPHPNYAQPPLYYYDTIFAKEPRKILVFYEDDANPVVNALKSKYPDALFNRVSLSMLIGIFMNARHIVNSVGTLITSISYFNKNMKTLYSCKEFPGATVIDLPNYISVWKNTEEQKALMLEYRHVPNLGTWL